MTEQTGQQTAQQLAEQAIQAARQASQQAEQAVQAAQQAARAVGAETSASTIETEVSPASIGKAWASNIKRTYDVYQNLDMVAASRSQTDFDTIRSYAQLALANAVNNADLLAKQAIAHRDIAIERQWNLNDDTLALKVVADVVDDK